MSIANNLHRVRATLHPGVTLTAVSKFHPVEALMEAYNAGQRVFGESRVQELAAKVPALPADVVWHFIGHLQTNKVRRLLSLPVALIESVDSEHLLQAIDAEALRAGRIARVLMQVHVAQEETKFGFTPAELIDYMERHAFRSLRATHLCGVMGMASNTDNIQRIKADLSLIADTAQKARQAAGSELVGFNIVSMGMSGDYLQAMECGSTMVRIGTDIFGEREY